MPNWHNRCASSESTIRSCEEQGAQDVIGFGPTVTSHDDHRLQQRLGTGKLICSGLEVTPPASNHSQSQHNYRAAIHATVANRFCNMATLPKSRFHLSASTPARNRALLWFPTYWIARSRSTSSTRSQGVARSTPVPNGIVPRYSDAEYRSPSSTDRSNGGLYMSSLKPVSQETSFSETEGFLSVLSQLYLPSCQQDACAKLR